MLGRPRLVHFGLQVADAVLVFVNEGEDHLTTQSPSVGSSDLEGDEWGTWLTASIAARATEAVHVYDPVMPLIQDGKPSAEVSPQYLVLRAGVWLQRPQSRLGNWHVLPLPSADFR